MDRELKREIILDNYNNPYHKGLKNEKGYKKANTNNESCIDNIDIELKIEDGIVVDANFDGEACAISTSATSIFLRKIIGKSVSEVQDLIENYENLIDEQEYNEEKLGELMAYDTIYMQPNRKHCALLPVDTIKKILKEENSGANRTN